MAAQPGCEGLRRVMIDSTIVRAPSKRIPQATPVEKRGTAANCAAGRFAAVGDRRHDAPLSLPVPKEAAEALEQIDELLADKAFNSDAIRRDCLEVHNALPVVPNRSNRNDPSPWGEEMMQT